AHLNREWAVAVLSDAHIVVDRHVGGIGVYRPIRTAGGNREAGDRISLITEFVDSVGQKGNRSRIVGIAVVKGHAVGIADRLIGRGCFGVAIDIDVLSCSDERFSRCRHGCFSLRRLDFYLPAGALKSGSVSKACRAYLFFKSPSEKPLLSPCC